MSKRTRNDVMRVLPDFVLLLIVLAALLYLPWVLGALWGGG